MKYTMKSCWFLIVAIMVSDGVYNCFCFLWFLMVSEKVMEDPQVKKKMEMKTDEKLMKSRNNILVKSRK